MSELIVQGARTHNLRAVSWRVPHRSFVVVTGVSGSGKSSLVFDTIHAEGRRRYLEALAETDGSLRRPPVDAILGLPPTIALEQHERAPSPAETVGSLTEIYELISVVFARDGVQLEPTTGEAVRPWTQDQMLRDLLTHPVGARVTIEAPLLPSPDASLAGLIEEVRRAGFSRVRMRGRVVHVDEVDGRAPVDPELRVVVDRLKVEPDRRSRFAEALRTAGAAGRGVIVAAFDSGERVYVDRPFALSTRRVFPALSPALFSPSGLGRCPTCAGAGEQEGQTCPSCGGSRLREEARFVACFGWTMPRLVAAPLSEVEASFREITPGAGTGAAILDVRRRLSTLVDLGLGHLPLGARVSRLSRGERRRLRLARVAGGDLSGILYLIDEPTSGVAPDAAPAVLAALLRLREGGNTVIVVSHDRRLMEAADEVVDIGPGAGPDGGSIVYQGPPSELGRSTGPTGAWWRGDLPPASPGPPGGVRLPVRDLRPRRGPGSASVPIGGILVVTGPASAGASSWLETLASRLEVQPPPPIDRVLRVEEVRVGSARSSVATLVGLWDVLRELLAQTTEARIRGLTAGTFSLASPGGRCEACKGAGEVKVDLGFLPPAWLRCEVCDGHRFQEDVLDVRWRGRDASQLLASSASEAHTLLAGHPKLDRMLRALVDTGLGHLSLGQPTASLSGGENARLRLARELGRSQRGVEGAALVVDGPTDGLHPLDTVRLIDLLHTLARGGAAVLVASHDPLVIQSASELVDLGA